MLYLALDTKQVKILSLKKSLMNQYHSSFFSKYYQTELLKNGEIENLDFLASAIKEVLINLPQDHSKDKETILILPQESFLFFRCELPKEIAASAIGSFIKDKAKTDLKITLEDYVFNYTLFYHQAKNYLSFFALNKKLLLSYKNALELIDLKIINIIPETLAYYKLFEKTLRLDKQEIISYVIYEKERLKAYFYDSFGLIDNQCYLRDLDEKTDIQVILKEKGTEYLQQGKKINRLILSGVAATDIRQDTFTKAVGIWTNPLKRIIPNFYQDYLKMLITANQVLPILDADVCLGAFIFSKENKHFSLIKKSLLTNKIKFKIPLPKKELFIIAITSIISFFCFYLIFEIKSKALNFSLPQLTFTRTITPTLTPTQPPTPTSTPAFKKEELKIKILNGSGITGKAAALKKVLQDDQYGEIITGNADNNDYQSTIIRTKKNYLSAIPLLKTSLSEFLDSPQTDLLADEETADIIIIIGKDIK